MEDILKLTLLYDFYGELLTDKQKNIYEMYYQNDLSLTEIGEEINITRQGVRDQLKHAEKKLFDYESKLQFLEKFQTQQKNISNIKENLQEAKKTDDLNLISNIIDSIINNIDELED